MTNNKDMDYKELYNKALEKAKFYYNNCPLNPEKNKLEDMFPVLKESEDEKIRKALIEVFKKKLERGYEWVEYGIPNRSVLDWLEKQKERKPVININHLKSYMLQYLQDAANRKDDGEIEADTDYWAKKLLGLMEVEPKPAEWSEEDKRMLLSIINAFRNGTVSTIGQEQWLKSLPEKFNLQSKVEWGEDERIVLDSIIDDYEKTAKSFCGYDGKIMLLKAIRDGEYDLPKQEWSKEDEDELNDILAFVKNDIPISGDTRREFYNWLKSLRPTTLADTIKEVTKDKETAMKFLQSAGIADENGQLAEMYRTPAEQDDETLDTLDFIVGYLKYKGHEDDADWLNSIRRHFWKPSKEQMDALQEAYKAYYRGDNTNSNGLKLQMLYKEITEHLL